MRSVETNASPIVTIDIDGDVFWREASESNTMRLTTGATVSSVSPS